VSGRVSGRKKPPRGGGPVGLVLRRRAAGQWARPVAWRGSGVALAVTASGRLEVVPRGARGVPYEPTAQELVDGWELVDPDAVIAEGTSA
jgi:hypothetical protein